MDIQKTALNNAIDWVASINHATCESPLEPSAIDCQGFNVWWGKYGPLEGNLCPGVYAVDIETYNWDKQGDNWAPFCAVIYSFKEGTYHYWVSDHLPSFINLPISPGSILIGHNITAYDRQYFANEYGPGSPFLYIDTQCLAIRLRGISNQQTALYNLYQGDQFQGSGYQEPEWSKEHFTNSLSGLYEAYFDEPLDKGLRDEMTKKDLSWYLTNSQAILDYCAKDVWATVRLFQALWKESVEAFHPQSLHAMALLSTTRLPVNRDELAGYIDRGDEAYDCAMGEVSGLLEDLVEEVYKAFKEGKGAVPDRLKGLDWTPRKTGLPAWYIEAKKSRLTLAKKMAPILLGVHYNGLPVFFQKTGRLGTWATDAGPIPHPEGKQRLGEIFNKHHWALLGPGLPFTVANPDHYQVLEKVKHCQFWKAFKSRIQQAERFTARGWHIPSYLPWGTVSGRGKDRLWLVSPKPQAHVPGSELRTMVKAPLGYRIVGADFASQEMRLFALVGDSMTGRLGSSELSKLLMSGGDIHTALAERSGAPRGLCKNINYGAVYGLGLKSAELYCKLSGMPSPKAMAQGILDQLKGKKTPSGRYSGGIGSEAFNAVARLISKPDQVQTPILGNRISRALVTREFVTSRQNWIIQSSGSDMRDLFVTGLAAINPGYQLMLYVHDEPRYICQEDQAEQLAKDIQRVHLSVMERVFEELGIMADIPEPYKFFDAVEIDTVWRKDANQPCVTPTQPDPIPSGITLKP